MGCSEPKCCRHADCQRLGHDPVVVNGHGFSTICRRCGDAGIPVRKDIQPELWKKLTSQRGQVAAAIVGLFFLMSCGLIKIVGSIHDRKDKAAQEAQARKSERPKENR